MARRMAHRFLRVKAFAVSLAVLTGCGTTYELPETVGSYDAQARALFAQARHAPGPKPISVTAAEARFNRVARRVRPVGASTCRQLTQNRPDFNCNVDIAIDREMTDRNAYFTYRGGQPVIRMSMPLLRDTRNDDEVAFVIAHEYGHLIGRHIEKQQQQVLAGALIAGALVGVATAASGDFDGDAVAQGLGVGAAVGSISYSKEYELESDSVGTRIAHAAGYDAVQGAMYFARPERQRAANGGYSFWGTHPPDEKRLALVLATQAQIEKGQALRAAR